MFVTGIAGVGGGSVVEPVADSRFFSVRSSTSVGGVGSGCLAGPDGG